MKKYSGIAQVTGVIVAILSTAAFAGGFIGTDLWIVALSFGGFTGLAGLRQAIDSSGFKTLIVAASFAVLGTGVGFGIVTPDNAAIVFAVLGVGAIPTLNHAITKASINK